jgi:hypothetical protein
MGLLPGYYPSHQARFRTFQTSSVATCAPNTWFVQGFVSNLLNPKGTLYLSRRVYDGHYPRDLSERDASPHRQHDARSIMIDSSVR